MITLNPSNDRVANSLNTILKFGTVYLIYRSFSYLFLDNLNSQFNKSEFLLIIYILIGFTIYFLYVQPYLTINFQQYIFQNMSNDILMFSTVLITTHLLEEWSGNQHFFNYHWLKKASKILLSFAIYDITLYPLIPHEYVNRESNAMIFDWIKYGSVLIIFRIIQCKSIFDLHWIMSIIFILLGFFFYYFITNQLIQVK